MQQFAKAQYIYIVQASLESTKCKIGKSNDLERRLKEYNITDKSKENVYQYLFACEVTDMTRVENDIKEKYSHLREEKSLEIYFYNSALFELYVDFFKSHEMFVKEIFIKTENKQQIVKKTTPSLEERGIKKIDVLHKAKKINNDEFYTRYEDIEKEIAMYDKSVWEEKTVFCNCDDVVDNDERNTSAFALYFLRNFNKLHLKKLICTHYNGRADLLHTEPKGYAFTKDGFAEIKEYHKNYTGSFDDPLSLKILNEEADIVCTNPPFSRAIDYWNVIIKSGKKFLIISNITIAISTAFIKYFCNKKVWPGYNSVNEYLNSKRELASAAGHWYTNIPITNRPKYEKLKIMPLKEIPEKYKMYDDSEILLVDNNYIPIDYKKTFGVSTRPILNGLLEKGYEIINDKQYDPCINGKIHFKRVLVQKIEDNKK